MDNSKALYVYGIVFRLSHPTPLLAMGGEEKGEGGGVRFFPYQDIAALVSEVDLEEFGESSMAQNLKNLEWVKEKVMAHEKILEKVMASQTVIPLKFGAIFTSEDRLQKVLADSYEGFQYLLETLKDHSECAVKLYGDLDGLREIVARTSDRIQEVAKEMKEELPGVAYLLKKKFETVLREETDIEKARRLREIFNRLSAHSSDDKLGDLIPHELTGKDKPMIFNGIFLIVKSKMHEFTEEVANLKREVADLGWQVEQVGPFPPYNFSELPRVEEVPK